MIKGYCKKHYNNECLAIAMVYHVSNRFLKKNFRIYLWSSGIFTFVSSSTFLTAFWLLIFVSAEPSRAILSIDRSEPRFESHTGGKIMKTLKILTVFVNFRLSQIQNYSVQIKKMKDKLFRKLKKKLLLPNIYKRC